VHAQSDMAVLGWSEEDLARWRRRADEVQEGVE
jgi:hypothetical protein